jgi:hypothetical protein
MTRNLVLAPSARVVHRIPNLESLTNCYHTSLSVAIVVLADPLLVGFSCSACARRACPPQLFFGLQGCGMATQTVHKMETESTIRTVESSCSSQHRHKNASIQQLSGRLAPNGRLVLQLLPSLVVAAPSPWHSLS